MEYFYLYLFTKLGDLKSLLGIVGGLVSCLFFIIALIASIVRYIDYSSYDEDNKDVKQMYKLIKMSKKYILYIAFPCILLAVFLPTQKQLAFIVVAPMVYNNGDIRDTVKEVPTIFKNLTQLASEYLKEQIKELPNGGEK